VVVIGEINAFNIDIAAWFALLIHLMLQQ